MNLVNKKYEILSKIGEGSFGSIYKGMNTRTRENVAIKIERINDNIKLLKNESIMYQYLNGLKGIPHVRWFGKDNVNYYMVIDLLGISLQSLLQHYKKFSLKTTLQLGIKLIRLLETIHEKGLIHRDIKPDNFLFGPTNKLNEIYIIDFGFCKLYNRENTRPQKTNSLIGSLTYASINSHNLVELSRRDDLESIGYMLVCFYLGNLKWQHYDNKNKTVLNEIIKQEKCNTLKDTSIPCVLLNYLNDVRNLSFNETPNYEGYINIFEKEIAIIL
jgi:serine/threonine protein kinase